MTRWHFDFQLLYLLILFFCTCSMLTEEMKFGFEVGCKFGRRLGSVDQLNLFGGFSIFLHINPFPLTELYLLCVNFIQTSSNFSSVVQLFLNTSGLTVLINCMFLREQASVRNFDAFHMNMICVSCMILESFLSASSL